MKQLALIFALAACAAAQPKPTTRQPGLYAIFQTSEGEFTALLYEKETPGAVQTFVGLALGSIAWLDPETHKPVKRPLYRNITFHRVVPHDVIQAGDPTGIGNYNCGFTIRDEFLPGLRFDRSGRLAMANTGNPDSSGCQFFITSNVAPQWNGKYTIFGQVVEGQKVVDKIASVRVKDEKPLARVSLIGVRIERVRPVKR
jgi:cyclophilin family peptidyl-prolyl cis-trans isomerase